MASIKLTQLKKSYGRTEIIHGIDLAINDGELIVIVGPSGCGKSTLLRMIAGLEIVTSGTIEINDKVVNDVEPKDRDIAMVFQTYALYPHMSVFDNMAYGLKIAKIPTSEIEERVDNAAAILELKELLKRKPRELSGGQRQRVAMGRAIVRKPSVFLFDEPLSNLDALLRVQMRLEIKQLQRRLGVTSVYVTHDQTEAMTLADRLIVMNDGYAEQIDTPMAIYQKPATRYVAGFIGSPGMNFLAGIVASDNSGVQLTNGDFIPTTAYAPNDSSGTNVSVGIRPEHIQRVQAENAQFAMHVVTVENLGADTIAHGFLINNGAASDDRGERMAVRLEGGDVINESETLYLHASPENIHLFNSQTGVRY